LIAVAVSTLEEVEESGQSAAWEATINASEKLNDSEISAPLQQEPQHPQFGRNQSPTEDGVTLRVTPSSIMVVPKAGFGAMVEIIEFFGLIVLILSTMKH
jgi:hypothetical protein